MATNKLTLRQLRWLQLMGDAMFFHIEAIPMKRTKINSERWAEDGFVTVEIYVDPSILILKKPGGVYGSSWKKHCVEFKVPLGVLHNLDGKWLVQQVWGDETDNVLAKNDWLKSNMLIGER